MEFVKVNKYIGFLLARIFGEKLVGVDASGEKLTIAKGAKFRGKFYIFKLEVLDAQFKNGKHKY